jgi:hypothetical protein
MRRTVLVLSVVALVSLAVWAVYAYAQGRQVCDVKTRQTTECAAVCKAQDCHPAGSCHDGTMPACGATGTCVCHGPDGCAACPEFVDENADGVCDAIETCAKRAQCECRAGRGCHNRQIDAAVKGG